MTDNFWESLRRGFTQLRADCAIDPPLDPGGRLFAIWTADPPSWRLRYHNGEDRSGIKERFAWHAESGAARLGCLETGQASLGFWLDQIKRDAPAQYLRRVTAGDSEQLYSVDLFDICGLSAEYCRKCEADEIRSRTEPTRIALKNEARLGVGAPESQAQHAPQIRPGMLSPPSLPEVTERQLALRWQQALEQRDFTGKHLHWHDRLRGPSGRIKLRPGVDRTYGQVGVAQSVVVAERNFGDVVEQYFDIWDRSSLVHEVFKLWLPFITTRVLGDMAVLWKGHNPGTDEWYSKVCEPTLKHVLGKNETAWVRRARDRELLRLERGHILEPLASMEDAGPLTSDPPRSAPHSAAVPPFSIVKATLSAQVEPRDDQPIEGHGTLAEQRQAAIKNFLVCCQRDTGVRISKKHIWLAASHKQPRQFQYWQAGQDRISGDRGTRGATEEDDRNFRRILQMVPAAFVALLRKQKILADSQ